MPPNEGKLIWGIGPALVAPTHTDDALGNDKWVAGPADTDQYIKGSASEFCRVAVQRMDLAEAENLHAHGEVAEKALRLVRTYL